MYICVSLYVHLHGSTSPVNIVVNVAEPVPATLGSRAVLEAFHVLRAELHTGEILSEMLCICGGIELRLIRGWNFLFLDGLPVDAIEPGVLLNVLCVPFTCS